MRDVHFGWVKMRIYNFLLVHRNLHIFSSNVGANVVDNVVYCCLSLAPFQRYSDQSQSCPKSRQILLTRELGKKKREKKNISSKT